MTTRFAKIIGQVRKETGLVTDKTYTDPTKTGRRTSLMLQWSKHNTEVASTCATRLLELFEAEGTKPVIRVQMSGWDDYVERICIYMTTEDRKKLGCNDTVYERYAA